MYYEVNETDEMDDSGNDPTFGHNDMSVAAGVTPTEIRNLRWMGLRPGSFNKLFLSYILSIVHR